jgi:hypothetical protein
MRKWEELDAREQERAIERVADSIFEFGRAKIEMDTARYQRSDWVKVNEELAANGRSSSKITRRSWKVQAEFLKRQLVQDLWESWPIWELAEKSAQLAFYPAQDEIVLDLGPDPLSWTL